MLKYSLRRLLGAIPTLFVLIAFSFLLIRAAPGGPFDSERRLLPEVEANLRAAYHLDEPLYEQFGRYVWGLVRVDFGPSFQYRDYTVTELIEAGFPVSLKLGGGRDAARASASASRPAASRRSSQNSMADYGVMTVAMTGMSIPNFVMAPLLILLFAVYLALAARRRLGRRLAAQHGAAGRGAGLAADRLSCSAHAREHDRGAAGAISSVPPKPRVCRLGRSFCDMRSSPPCCPSCRISGPPWPP